MTEQAPFSKAWMLGSVGIFVCCELLLGGALPHLLDGRFVSHPLLLKLQVILMLASFYLGGLIVGLVSPGPRLAEPAVGAALSVAFTFVFALFTPLAFYQFTTGKLLIGSVIAFLIALAGAHHGEKLTGN